MKKIYLFFLTTLLLMAPFVNLFALSQDISGTWVGSTEVPGMEEADELTMVIVKSEGSYSGTISDSMGMAQDAEMNDISFEDKTLTFDFSVDTGEEIMTVSVSLEVDDDTMSGHWQAEDGSTGSIEMSKEN